MTKQPKPIFLASYYIVAGIICTAVQSLAFDYQVVLQMFEGWQAIALTGIIGIAVARFLPMALAAKRRGASALVWGFAMLVFVFGVTATLGMNVFRGIQLIQINAEQKAANPDAVHVQLEKDALKELEDVRQQREYYRGQERQRNQAWLNSHNMANEIEDKAMAKLIMAQKLKKDAIALHFSFENSWHICVMVFLLSFFVLVSVGFSILADSILASVYSAQRLQYNANIPKHQTPPGRDLSPPDSVLPSRLSAVPSVASKASARRNGKKPDMKEIYEEICAAYERLAAEGEIQPGAGGWEWEEMFASNRRKAGDAKPTHIELSNQYIAFLTPHYIRNFRDYAKECLIRYGYFDTDHNFLGVPKKVKVAEVNSNGAH